MSRTRAIRSPPERIYCRATMNYIAAKSRHGEELQPTEVVIHDGRHAELPGWRTTGFELMRLPSAVCGWDDDAEIARVHYAEVAAHAKKLTGCDHALVSSHIKRNVEQAALHPDLGPISYVHSDFAASYGDRIRDFYATGTNEAQQALARAQTTALAVATARRTMIVQFWRNVGPTKMDLPLAFCDCRTVGSDEMREVPVINYAGGGFDFDALAVVAPGSSRQHHWYVFPEMQIDECVVFRTYDSELAANHRAFWTPHSAFRDPGVPAGGPRRRSVELRATCLFE